MISTIFDVNERKVIDVIGGRYGIELDEWLSDRPQAWKDAVQATVTDPAPPVPSGPVPTPTADFSERKSRISPSAHTPRR